MRQNTIRISLAVAALSLVVTGCSHTRNHSDEAAMNAHDQMERTEGTIPVAWQTDRDNYADQVQNRLNDFNQRISDLNATIPTEMPRHQERTKKLVKDLQARVDKVQGDYNDFKVSTADNYSARRGRLENDLAKAEDSYNQSKTVATRK